MTAACPADDELVLMVEGGLAHDVLRRIESHIDTCPTCASVVANLGALGSAPYGQDLALEAVSPTHYTIVGELARGGMGRILRAHDRRLGRVVAIKENFVTTGEPARRFEREARITARLQHPSIVQVHDAGLWPSGEPFFAMQLVAGRSLDKVIAAATTLERRLALVPNVLAVADAIAYAHSRRVIHRDLKPRNVIVGEFGETVVIDWGLAKDLSGGVPELAEDPMLAVGSPGGETEAGTVLGTPSYMPPEQALGEAIDERADVYALGALLFHVLAGRPPVTGGASAEVLAKVVSGDLPDLAEVQPGVPSDLAAIVAKAMAGEPAKRYPTARELADDLRQFQTGQLVSARQYSRAQLLARWLRRHRTAVGVISLSAVVLAVVGVVSIRRVVRAEHVAEAERGEAERNRGDAEELMRFMLGDLRDKLQPIGKLELLDVVATKAKAYYERRPVRGTQDLRAHAVALGELGDVLLARGQTSDALVQYRTALVETTALVVQDPTNEQWQRDLSIRRSHLGAALALAGDTAAALAEYQADLAIATRLAARAPADLGRQRDLAVSHEKVADELDTQGRMAEAIAEYRMSLAISERVAAAAPTPNHQRDVAVGHARLADALQLNGEGAAALVEHRTALAIRERLVAGDRANADWQRDLASSHEMIGELLVAANQLPEAIAELRAAVALSEQLAARDAANADWQSALAFGHYSLGKALRKASKLDDAVAEYRAALAIQERVAAADPAHTDRARDVEITHKGIGEIEDARGDHAAARADFTVELDLAVKLAAQDPNNLAWQRDLGIVHEKLGHNRELAGDFAAAETEYRASLAARLAVAARDPANTDWANDTAVAHYNLAEVLAKRDLDAALAEHRAALAVTEQLLAREPDNDARKADLADSKDRIAALEKARSAAARKPAR